MERIILLLILNCFSTVLFSQVLKGKVYDIETGIGLPSVSITSKMTGLVMKSDSNGAFEIVHPKLGDTLLFKYLGYEDSSVILKRNDFIVDVGMKLKSTAIEEVKVNTGYQTLRADQLSGAAQVIGESQLNQRVGTNILDRLNHVANAVYFDNQLELSGNQQHNFSIRGLSTIDGMRDPLIVLDGFIYEGNIQNIDPNSIESITVLKDAAASAIWGARAGNGVLVIQSKGAKETNGKTRFMLNKSTQLSQKPNLYDVYQMPATDFIEIERTLFNSGYYDRDIRRNPYNAISPAIKLLQNHKSGIIDAAELENGLKKLSQIDSRQDYMDYFMEYPLIDQYSLSLTNGNENNSVYIGVGYTYEKSQYADKNKKLNIDFNDKLKLTSKLALDFGFKFTDASNSQGKPTFESLSYRNMRVPYMDLVDENGVGLVLEKLYNKDYTDSYLPGKLLSWDYVPYEDYKTSDLLTFRREYLAQAQLTYKVFPFLDAFLSYQRQSQSNNQRGRNDVSSYYTRTWINTYASYDAPSERMIYPIPIGDILITDIVNTNSYNWRGQMNVNKAWTNLVLNGIAGGEIRESKVEGESNTLYGYSNDPLKNIAVDFISDYPIGINYSSGTIPGRPDLYASTNRFVSFYTNWNLEYNNEYGITASMRRDGANIFGIATKEKWTPFWSAGGYWNVPTPWISKAYLERLKLRASYGVSGNVDLRKTAQPIAENIRYNYSPYNGLIISQLNDPELRWEKISTFNIGFDLTMFEGRIRANVDYYNKLGTDLYGMTEYDYTTWGYLPFIIKNVASMKGKGWDVIIDSDNIRSMFSWSTRFNIAINKSKTSKYYAPYSLNASRFLGPGLSITALDGYPLYGIAGYKDGGLDENGNPQGYLNGQLSTDYYAISKESVDLGEDGNIVFKGSSKPQVFGSIINNFYYKKWSLTANVSFQGDYYFMKNVTSYASLFSRGKAYADVENRWKEKGDELKTTTPSMLYPLNEMRESLNTLSAKNIFRADHVRLEYVRLSYATALKKKIGIECFVNISNLGLLWIKNDNKIDPMYQDRVKPPTMYTIGAFINFNN